MNRWLPKNGLKLTSNGERAIVTGVGVWIVFMVGTASWLEGNINTNVRVI
ncbi:hypothetical protein ACT3UQ_05175 [Glutamicibacter sp. AOP12-B1-11]